MGEEIADSSTQGEDSVFQGIGQNKTNTIHVDIDIQGLSQLSGWSEKCSLL